MCQHKASHSPWQPPLKYLHLFDDVTIPEPETLFDDYSGRGEAEKTQRMTIAKTMNLKWDLKLTTARRAQTPSRRRLGKRHTARKLDTRPSRAL